MINEFEIKEIEITKEDLHEICELTIKLVELRQNECKHLCIENLAPEMFASLLGALRNSKIILPPEKSRIEVAALGWINEQKKKFEQCGL